MPDYFIFDLNGHNDVCLFGFARFYLMKIKRTFLLFYLCAFYVVVV